MLLFELQAEWVTAGATVATAAILFLSARFALWQLRESENTRYAELIADLSRRWDEPFMKESRKAVSRNTPLEIGLVAARLYRGTGSRDDEEDFLILQALPNFIETLAVLEYGNLQTPPMSALDLRLIDRLWGSSIIAAWKKWERAIRFLRRRSGEPRVYDNFELLVLRIEWLHRAYAWEAWLAAHPSP